MSLRAGRWEASVPVESVDIPMIFFIRANPGGAMQLSPMRICAPRAAQAALEIAINYATVRSTFGALLATIMAGNGTLGDYSTVPYQSTHNTGGAVMSATPRMAIAAMKGPTAGMNSSAAAISRFVQSVYFQISRRLSRKQKLWEQGAHSGSKDSGSMIPTFTKKMMTV